MSESFGARLRHERERRDIDLASIAANTKVKIALFEGLERDDVSRWPSGIFRRAFIRAYATAVGLDPEPIVREFLERFPDPAEPPKPEAAGGSRLERGAATQPGTELRLTMADTGLAFAGGRVLALLRQRWAAVAWDTSVVLAIAVSLFVVLGEFWSSLGISMLCYHVCGILILGNTPGVYFLAPRPRDDARVDERSASSMSPPPSTRLAEPSLEGPSTVYPFKAVRRMR